MKWGEICARSARSSAWATLHLRRDQARGLLDDAQLVVARPSDGPVEGDQRPDPRVLRDQRHQYGRTERTGRIRGDQPRHDVHVIVPGSLEQAREQIARTDLLAALAVDRQDRTRIRQRDRGGAGQRAEIRDGSFRVAAGQSFPEMRKRGGGGVQRGLHGRLRDPGGAGAAHGAPDRRDNRRQSDP
jgi:hypothetical protein